VVIATERASLLLVSCCPRSIHPISFPHSAHLFHPQRPHPDLLLHLIHLFISKLWCNFALLDLTYLRGSKLSYPVLANGIAALASLLSTHRNFVESNVKKQLYGEPYLQRVHTLPPQRVRLWWLHPWNDFTLCYSWLGQSTEVWLLLRCSCQSLVGWTFTVALLSTLLSNWVSTN
jgi:hypothetical protein